MRSNRPSTWCSRFILSTLALVTIACGPTIKDGSASSTGPDAGTPLGLINAVMSQNRPLSALEQTLLSLNGSVTTIVLSPLPKLCETLSEGATPTQLQVVLDLFGASGNQASPITASGDIALTTLDLSPLWGPLSGVAKVETSPSSGCVGKQGGNYYLSGQVSLTEVDSAHIRGSFQLSQNPGGTEPDPTLVTGSFDALACTAVGDSC